MGTSRSLQRQVLTILLVSIAGVMLVALVLSALLLRFTLQREFETRLRTTAQDLQTTVARGRDGAIDLGDFAPDIAFSERFSGWYWLVRDGESVVARSRSLVAENLATGGLGESRAVEGPRGESLLALSLPVRGAGDLSVTVAGPKSAIDQALLNDLWTVVISVVTLGLILMFVVRWQVNRALGPLRHLAEDLGRLRTGVLAEIPPSRFFELNAVATLVNGLLADSRDLVVHARDTAAKLAHGLKTPLAVLAARFGTGSASQDPKVTDAVDSMRRLIDQNLKVARAARISTALSDTVPVRPIVEDLVFAFSHVFRERRLVANVDISEDEEFRGNRDDLQEMLGNILENAHAWAASRVCVNAARHESGDLTIAIRDDGPGFPVSILAAMAQDDSSAPLNGPTGERHGPSNGLGLRITRDIAARYGGRLDLANCSEGGAIATLRLP